MTNNRLGVLIGGMVALATLLPTDATACGRCGSYSRCRYYAPKPAYVAPAQANVFVVQNAYAPPLVQQGSSYYQSTGAGYQAQVLPLIDPNRYVEGSLMLQKASVESQAIMYERTLGFVREVSALQAPALERLAAGQAASMVLKASGLDPAHNAGGGSQAVVINRDEYGRVQVVPLSPEQTQRLSTNIIQRVDTTPPPQNPGTAPSGSLVSQFCYSCHGPQLSQPKGGLYLGPDPNTTRVMEQKWFKITSALSGKSKHPMPPSDSPQPTPEQRGGIIDELQAMIEGDNVAPSGNGTTSQPPPIPAPPSQ